MHTAPPLPPNDRREIFGWMVYDWANSAFYTTVVTALFGPYLTALAQAGVGENGTVLGFGPLGSVTAKSFFPFCVFASVFLQVFLLPFLGGVADYSPFKKRLMFGFCYLGVAATCLLFFVTENLYLLGGLLYMIANLAYGASIVIYNSFLPEIATPDQRDRVSSRGFALGYLGGGLLLAANLGFLYFAADVGVSRGFAVRLCLLSAGLWWGGFALFAFARLRSRPAARQLAANQNYFSVGVTETRATLGELRRLPDTLRFLLAYLFYNDGIQTVITMSGVFLAQELFVARGVTDYESFLVGLVLVVQFLAVAGALLFERVANWFGAKNAILISLALWCAVVIFAYAALQTINQAWGMASVIAVVLGGSQALSRSLFSRMIPAGREASFFGFYEISERGTSWMGPIVFGVVVAYTNSYRQAVLSLIVFFLVGTILLWTTDTRRAVERAGQFTRH